MFDAMTITLLTMEAIVVMPFSIVDHAAILNADFMVFEWQALSAHLGEGL